MILLLDIGNTNTHAGLANQSRVVRNCTFPTNNWSGQRAKNLLKKFLSSATLDGAIFCSVVPKANARVQQVLKSAWKSTPLQLTSRTVRGLRFD